MKSKELVYVRKSVTHIRNHGWQPICCQKITGTWKRGKGKPTCKNCIKWDKINKRTLVGKVVWLVIPADPNDPRLKE